jgi:hypothetical protein
MVFHFSFFPAPFPPKNHHLTKDNSCLWEPRSKEGRTDGQALAQDAGVAALSFAASFMACEEAYQAGAV